MMRKNVLLFGHGYGTQFIDISNQYTKLFDKNKHAVTVVYLVGEPDEAIRKRHLADQVIFLNSPKKSVRGLKIDAIKRMLALTREKNFEIVVCHRYKPTYVMLLVSRFHPIPALISVMHELGTLSSFARKILIAALAKDNILFAGVSNAVRDDLRQAIWRIPSERVITLYNMLDVDLTEPKLLSRKEARQQLDLPDDTFVFGTIGRLAKNKDQKTLIQAFAAIKNQCPKAKLIILGDGILEHELKQLTHSLHLQDDVIFTGYRNDAFSFAKAFDVFISSSIQEAFGRVLLEAMIAKTPIIATKVNGIPEVIGDSGILIDCNKPSELAAEMLKAYQMETSTLSKWGEQGYQRVNNQFSLKQFNEIFWQIPLIQKKEST